MDLVDLYLGSCMVSWGLFYHSMLSHNISYEIVLNCYWAITLISRVHVLMGYTDIQGALYGGIH